MHTRIAIDFGCRGLQVFAFTRLAPPSMVIASCTPVFVVCTVLAGLKVLSMCSLSTISIQLAGEILYELLPNPQFELVRHDICFPL